MKNLIIMRHGEAENAFVNDKERALTRRGREQAESTGGYIAKTFPVPDKVYVSTALRTRQTLECVSKHVQFDPQKIIFDDELYLASTDTLLKKIELSDGNSLLLIGHNPGLHDLVSYLAGNTIEGYYGMGVACVAGLTGEWDLVQLETGSMKMENVFCPS